MTGRLAEHDGGTPRHDQPPVRGARACRGTAVAHAEQVSVDHPGRSGRGVTRSSPAARSAPPFRSPSRRWSAARVPPAVRPCVPSLALTETVLAPPGPCPRAPSGRDGRGDGDREQRNRADDDGRERHGWRRTPGSAAAGPGSPDGERGVMSVACPFGRKPCGCPPSLAYTAITGRVACSRTSAALANRCRRLDGDRWLVFHCCPCPAARPGPASPPWSPGGGHQNRRGAPRCAAGCEWLR